MAHYLGVTSPRRPRMTFEEFLSSPYERAEWVDGEVFELSPENVEHAGAGGWLYSLLRAFVEEHGQGRVLSGVLMKTGPHLAGRVPDVLFLSREHEDRIRRNHVEGPADLAIEVTSPDSEVRDRDTKRREYEQGGVREYWIVDLLRGEVAFLSLEEGRYRAASDRGRRHGAKSRAPRALAPARVAPRRAPPEATRGAARLGPRLARRAGRSGLTSGHVTPLAGGHGIPLPRSGAPQGSRPAPRRAPGRSDAPADPRRAARPGRGAGRGPAAAPGARGGPPPLADPVGPARVRQDHARPRHPAPHPGPLRGHERGAVGREGAARGAEGGRGPAPRPGRSARSSSSTRSIATTRRSRMRCSRTWSRATSSSSAPPPRTRPSR